MLTLIFKESLFGDSHNAHELFDQCMALRGEIYKASPARVVYRFIHNNQAYFIKVHQGVGWREIVKNLTQLKCPVLGARHEWQALLRLQTLKIPTLTPVGMGLRGLNPASRQSFLITRELRDTVSLEDITANWQTQKPKFALKRALILALARVVGDMHRGGVNHRDCYLCHFLLHIPGGIKQCNVQQLTLHIVDLHRAQIRRRVPVRWLVKDLAGLYFSSVDAGITRRDVYRFMKAYKEKSLCEIIKNESTFWRHVERKAKALRRKHNKL